MDHSKWEAVIGLEIHVQLATQSKIFSGAPVKFGEPANTQACAIDLGLPGVLPVLNEEAVKMAIMFGLAVGAKINPYSIFDRKNYFYPDLPKGYQISQFANPIVGEGTLDIDIQNGETKSIGITRAHLEEDAGKSIHDAYQGNTAIDLNRTGTPLLEIVSEPDLRSAEEASAYFRKLASLVRYLKICDGDMSQGSLRCDANVSIRETGSTELGQRTEIKNINSFRFVEKAINHEINRQAEIIESGGIVKQETLLYDSELDETRSMRSKEYSNDYRYFPDPDLLPLSLSEELIKNIQAKLPELPEIKRTRFVNELGVSEQEANWLTEDPEIADFFESTLAVCNDAKLSANWIKGELSAALNREEKRLSETKLTGADLGSLIKRIIDGTISNKTAKIVFEKIWQDGSSVDSVIEEFDLKQVSDVGELNKVVEEILRQNPKQVEQFKAGKEKVLGFFVGKVMQKTKGKANPQQVNEIIHELISKTP